MKPTGRQLRRQRRAVRRIVWPAPFLLASAGAILLAAAIGSGCGVSGVAGEPEKQGQEGAFEVTGAQLTQVSDTSAVLAWTTNRPAAGVLRLGVSADLSTSVTRTAESFATLHELAIEDLQPDTPYHYRIQAISARGDTASARGQSFRTDPSHALHDATPPLLSGIEVLSVTSSSAQVRWRTDDLCRCLLVYGLAGAGDQALAEYPQEPAKYTRGHSLTLTDLSPSSSYTFVIQATNLAALTTDGAGASFFTLAAPSLGFCPGLVIAEASGEFTLSLCIAEARDLAGAEVTIGYDPQAVELIDGSSGVSPGPFFHDRGGHLFMPARVDPYAGRIGLEASWLITYQGDEARGTQADGAGTLCTLHFRWRTAFAGGTTQVGFITADEEGDGEADTRLLDYNRLPIRFDSLPGEVRRP